MRSYSVVVMALASLTSAVVAQCGHTLVPLGDFAGNSYLFSDSVLVDLDGTGPLPPRIVCTAVNTNAGPGGPTALGIAAFDEGTGIWTPLGSGIVQGYALHLAVLPNGELIVGGQFASVSGVAVNNIASWTGSTFVPLGNGVASRVEAMKVAPNGDLVVLAGATVQRWNGTQWSPVGSLPSPHKNLAIAANGDMVVSNAGGFLLWNGSNWVAHAPGMNAVDNMAFMPNGHLFAAGALAGQPNFHMHFAEWDGSAWTPLGGSWNFPFGAHYISDILFLPNGDPVIGGQLMFYVGGQVGGSPHGTLRWDGTSWQSFPPVAQTRALTFAPSGLYIAGSLDLSRCETTCPATVVAAGSGCPGSGGANVLEVAAPAWLGGTFRSRGHGLPGLALAAAAYGFAPLLLPLSLVFAEAQPGCNLLTTPDIVDFSLVTGGQATSAIAIPSNPALLGGVFHHQLNLYEFTAGGTLVSVTASNAVTATVGSF